MVQLLLTTFSCLATLLAVAQGIALPEQQKQQQSHDHTNFTCPTHDIVKTHCMGPKDCLYPNKGECGTFIQCSVNADDRTGTPHVMKCPKGLEWYDAKKWCDFPENAKCKN